MPRSKVIRLLSLPGWSTIVHYSTRVVSLLNFTRKPQTIALGPTSTRSGGKMRKVLILCGLVLFAAGSVIAQDQPRGEVAGNYTYIRINPGGGASSLDCHGGGGSFAGNLNSYFGVVGEFAGCKVTGLASGLSEHAFTYVFGPRLTYRGHGGFEPFAAALLCRARFTINIHGTSASQTC